MPSFAANSVRAVGAALKRRFDIDAFLVPSLAYGHAAFALDRIRYPTVSMRLNPLDIFENSMRGLPTLPSVGYHNKHGMLNGQPESQPTNQPIYN